MEDNKNSWGLTPSEMKNLLALACLFSRAFEYAQDEEELKEDEECLKEDEPKEEKCACERCTREEQEVCKHLKDETCVLDKSGVLPAKEKNAHVRLKDIIENWEKETYVLNHDAEETANYLTKLIHKSVYNTTFDVRFFAPIEGEKNCINGVTFEYILDSSDECYSNLLRVLTNAFASNSEYSKRFMDTVKAMLECKLYDEFNDNNDRLNPQYRIELFIDTAANVAKNTGDDFFKKKHFVDMNSDLEKSITLVNDFNEYLEIHVGETPIFVKINIHF